MKLLFADLQSCSSNHGQSIGHFTALAARYVRLLRDYCYVTIAGGPVYQRYFNDDNLYCLPCDTSPAMSSGQSLLAMVKNAWRLFRKAKNQIIILQYAKPFSNHIAVLLAYRKCNLYLIQYSTNGIDTPIKRLIWRLIRHRVKGIICPNEEIGRAFGIPYCVVSDYIYIPEEECMRDEKKYDICLVGRITGAKGVTEAVRRLRNTRYKVLVAGLPQTRQIGMTVFEACKDVANIDLRLHYLSDNDYRECLRMSRYALLNYSDWYSVSSSGAVLDALFCKVPVIGRRCKTLQFIEDRGLGMIYDDINSFDFSRCCDDDIYNQLMNNIRDYQQENASQIYKLRRFLRIT